MHCCCLCRSSHIYIHILFIKQGVSNSWTLLRVPCVQLVQKPQVADALCYNGGFNYLPGRIQNIKFWVVNILTEFTIVGIQWLLDDKCKPKAEKKKRKQIQRHKKITISFLVPKCPLPFR